MPKLRKPEKTHRPGLNGGANACNSLLTQQLLEIAEGILMEGFTMTVKSLCRQLRITTKTYHNWMKKHPIFREVIEEAMAIRDSRTTEKIERSLARSALGFHYYEVTKEPAAVADKRTGRAKMVITKKVRKLVTPDVKAQHLWLKNREPERWPDKREISGTITIEDRLLKLAESRNGDGDGDSSEE